MSSGVCYRFRDTGFCSFGSRCKFSHEASSRRSKASPSPPESEASVPSSHSSASDPEDGHIASFFNSYSGFDYNPAKDVMREWRRLCAFLDVDPEDNDEFLVRETKRNLRTAMVRQFNARYGEDADDLAAWQALCLRVDIPVPDTLAECQEAIRGTHVNLVDLTQLRDGAAVKKYPTEIALAEYTKRTGKFFGRDHDEAGDLLRMLLRHIINPRPEWQVRAGGNFKRGRRRR